MLLLHVVLLQVMRDTYEYHGLNDLFWFCITALSVTLVRANRLWGITSSPTACARQVLEQSAPAGSAADTSIIGGVH